MPVNRLAKPSGHLSCISHWDEGNPKVTAVTTHHVKLEETPPLHIYSGNPAHSQEQV